MTRRPIALLALALGLLFAGAADAGKAQGRFTSERLARAAKIRKVRAGTEPTAVSLASQDSLLEMSHLLSPDQRTVLDYKPYQRIVFLSDGDPRKWASLAEPIFRIFPDKLIVKGDYDIAGTHRHGNFTAMHLDNTQALPLASGSADLVVMRRGLCLCHGSTMCGGLHPDVPQMRRFFKDVQRVLDPKNPNAVAYLHGSHGHPARIKVFQQAADELMAQDPSLRIEFVKDAYAWHAVRITHAKQPN